MRSTKLSFYTITIALLSSSIAQADLQSEISSIIAKGVAEFKICYNTIVAKDAVCLKAVQDSSSAASIDCSEKGIFGRTTVGPNTGADVCEIPLPPKCSQMTMNTYRRCLKNKSRDMNTDLMGLFK